MSADPDENPASEASQTEPRPPATLTRPGRLRTLWTVPTYRFAILFLSILVGMALAYPALRLRLGHQFRAVETFTAELVYRVARLFSSDAKLSEGSIVFLGDFPVAVIDECTGVYEAVLLGAALLAFPTSWGRTAIGFLIGFPLIYAMNVARIVMLLFVGRHFPYVFEFMHVYFWQVTMIAMVASVWLAWVLWVVRDEGAGQARETPRG